MARAAAPGCERSTAREVARAGKPATAGGATMSASDSVEISRPASTPSAVSRAVSLRPIMPAAPVIKTCTRHYTRRTPGRDAVNIRPNRVKQRLAAGQVATIVSGTNDPDLIDQLGTLDVDGIWLEGEHGGVDYADLGNLPRACDLWGKTSVVRVMDNDYATIYRTLDRGAQGICVPHVNTRAEAEAVVASAKFAPLGRRGMFTSRQGFGVSDYLKTANDQSLLIVLIEDIVAIKSLDEILEVDHIDIFFMAPNDLATSMGHIGNMGHPDVQKTIDAALTSIVRARRTAGMLVNADNVERYTKMGVRALMTSFFPWIAAGAATLLERARA